MEVEEASLAMSNQATRILDQDCKVRSPLTKTPLDKLAGFSFHPAYYPIRKSVSICIIVENQNLVKFLAGCYNINRYSLKVG